MRPNRKLPIQKAGGWVSRKYTDSACIKHTGRYRQCALTAEASGPPGNRKLPGLNVLCMQVGSHYLSRAPKGPSTYAVEAVLAGFPALSRKFVRACTENLVNRF